MLSRAALERSGWQCEIKAAKDLKFQGVAIKQRLQYTVPVYQAKALQSARAAEIISKPKFALYQDQQTRSLDFVSGMNLLFAGYDPVEVKTDKPLFTDVKTSTNIWKFEDWEKHGTVVSVSEATEFWSDQERDYLKVFRN